MNRLLAVLMLVCSVAFATAAPASAACPKHTPTLDQQAMQADAVFTGTVTDRTKQGSEIKYAVDVDGIYKGDVEDSEVISTPAAPRACGLPDLEIGDDYIFLATADGDQLTIAGDSGTAPATDAFAAQIEALLGPATSTAPEVPVEATITMVADPATSLQRLVAPGFALVLVGLLGLVLVVAIGRRRA